MLRRVYVLFFISLERRKVFLAGVTANPVGPWAPQQARYLVAALEDQAGPYVSLSATGTASSSVPSTRCCVLQGPELSRRPVERRRRTRSPRDYALATTESVIVPVESILQLEPEQAA
jgi:hypothetical protein